MIPTKDEAVQMAAVLGAMRLAVVGAHDPARGMEVVEMLLNEAPRQDEDDTRGVELLVKLLRQRRLQATVATRNEGC